MINLTLFMGIMDNLPFGGWEAVVAAEVGVCIRPAPESDVSEAASAAFTLYVAKKDWPGK